MASNLKPGLVLYVALLTSCLCKADAHNRQDNHFSESELENAIAGILQDTDDSCHLSGAREECQAAQYKHGGRTDFFHLCPSDGEPCNPELCYYSSIRPCCGGSNFQRCSSKSTLFLGGQTIEVTFYQVPIPGFEDQVCFRTSPDFSSLKACDCDLSCINKPPECPSNTKDCDADLNCECRQGYKLPDCCDCEDDNRTHSWFMDQETKECHPICRDNCIGRAPNSGQPCQSCLREFLPPDCCKCGDGQTVVRGTCKCRENTDDFGNCLPGYSSLNCCVCDTTGNDTHAYYMNDQKECIPYCKKNCQVRRSDGKGCEECKANYTGAPECCQCAEGYVTKNEICVQPANECDRSQIIHFLLDATLSNTLNGFCGTMLAVETLVAALSRTSVFNAVLFPRNKDDEPSTVINFSTTCDDIVDGETGIMSSVIEEFRMCDAAGKSSMSTKYPSMCGDATLAAPGLWKIAELVETEKEGRRQAVIIITDSNIGDTDRKIDEVMTALQNKGNGLSTVIAAALASNNRYEDINLDKLRQFTLNVNENAIVQNTPVNLVNAIVQRLEIENIICKEEADDVREALRGLNDMQGLELSLYCACVPHIGPCPVAKQFNIKSYIHPTCGGTSGPLSLKIGIDYTNEQSENLEEQIVAAVESVLEKYID